MQFAPSSPIRPTRERVLDGTVLLAISGLALVLPLFLPGGEPEHGPLFGLGGFALVAVLLRACSRLRIDVQLAAVGALAGVLAVWTLLAPGQIATADDPSNLLMPLAPAFPVYAGYRYAHDRRRAWVIVAVIAVLVTHPWSSSITAAAAGLLYVCTPMLFGFYLAARQQLLHTLTDRAESAERERDLLADRARTEERVGLAAELHDIVTHRISLMVLQAGALRITAAEQATKEAAERLRTIGSDAMEELRDLIGVLRHVQSPRPAETVQRADPPPDSTDHGSDRPTGRTRVAGSDLGVAIAGLAWTFLLITALMAWQSSVGRAEWEIPWFEIAIQAPVAAMLVVRRGHPHLVVLVTILDALLILGFVLSGPAAGLASGASTMLLVPVATPLVTYAVAVYSRRPIAGAALVLGLATLAARPWAPHVPVVTVAAVFVGAPALLGMYVGARRRLIAALVERADRARWEQCLLADQARADERARLAQEIPDIVVGRMHQMLEQADRIGDGAPSAPTTDAAAELSATGRQALDELHNLVAALGGSDETPVPGPHGTVAGGAELARLTEESASVGVPVELVQEGDQASTSPAVTRTVHHIVREALTNARKHAYRAPVRVHVRYGPDQVRIEVRNDRPPASSVAPHSAESTLAAGGSGTGLLGLRHRVELTGGTVTAGPTGEGGFVVDAILPAYVPTSASNAAEPSR